MSPASTAVAAIPPAAAVPRAPAPALAPAAAGDEAHAGQGIPAAAPPSPPPPLPAGVLVEIEGRRFTYGDLAQWIGQSGLAYAHRKEFVRDRLIRMRCEERGIEVSPRESRRRAEEELEKVVALRHHGSRESFEKELAEGGFTWESYLEMRRGRLEVEMLLERLAEAEGVGRDEAAVRREFQVLYGRPASAPRLRLVRFAVPAPPESGARDFHAQEEVRRVAEGFASGLRGTAVEGRAGAFAAALAAATAELQASTHPALVSAPPPVIERIARYARVSRGGSLDAVVRSIGAGEVRGPVFLDGAYTVVWCESIDSVAIDDVREEILARLRARPPDAMSLRAFGFRLMQEASIRDPAAIRD